MKWFFPKHMALGEVVSASLIYVLLLLLPVDIREEEPWCWERLFHSPALVLELAEAK